jgi:hypothetical protein
MVRTHYSRDHYAKCLDEAQEDEVVSISLCMCCAAMTMWGRMSAEEGYFEASEVLKDIFGEFAVFGADFARSVLDHGWGRGFD